MDLRKPVAVALAALTAVGLAACGSDETPAVEGGPVTITVAAPAGTWQETLGDAFHEAYPDVTVEFTDLAAGGAADALGSADVVSVADLSQLAGWINDKKVLDVTDIASTVTAPSVTAYAVSATDASGNTTQTAYGVPYAQDPYLLFYNADLFTKAGVAAPDGKWLWSTYVTAATTLTDKLKSSGVTGTALGAGAAAGPGFAYAQAGTADLMGGTDYTFLKTAYTTIAGLVTAGAVPADASTTPADLFTSGKAAMVLAPASLALDLAGSASFTWGLAPVPQRDNLTTGYDKTPVTMGDPVGFVIPSAIDPAHLDGAKQWLTFISSETAAILLAGEGVVPAIAGDGESNAYWSHDGLPTDTLSEFAFLTRTTNPVTPLDAKAADVWQAINDTTAQIVADGNADDIDSAITDLTDKIAKIVK
ncbi:MAG: extracellular solute-binding protein [Propionibacteriaceae bacterium]|jgi:multiple sugar transport system substrate-binding protein|nr:extracellular solute-binding protein [Propionibacteriaceae bacterium]